jgi:diguanylate cyclase (GGDEF)-like protein
MNETKQWHFETEIIAISLLLILFFDGIHKLDRGRKRDRVFLFCLASGLLFSLIDLLDSVLEIYVANLPLLFVARSFYYLAAPLPAMMWFFYLFSLVYEDDPHRFKIWSIVSWSIFSTFSIFVFANIWTHHIFYFDNQLVAIHGSLYVLCFVYCGLYSLLFFILFFINRKKIIYIQLKVALVLLPLIAWVGILLEQVKGDWQMFGPAYSIAMLVAYLFVQTQQAQQTIGRLSHEAMTDPLTGLENRAAFESKISAELHSNDAKTLYLLLIDIDNLKGINDTLGHPSGDAAITGLGKALQTVFSDAKSVSRIGGDEFAIVLTNKTVDEIANRMSSLFSSLSQQKVVGPDGKSMELTCSAGIAYKNEQSRDLASIYHHSDVALYAVKRKGKMSFAFYQKDMEKDYFDPKKAP